MHEGFAELCSTAQNVLQQPRNPNQSIGLSARAGQQALLGGSATSGPGTSASRTDKRDTDGSHITILQTRPSASFGGEGFATSSIREAGGGSSAARSISSAGPQQVRTRQPRQLQKADPRTIAVKDTAISSRFQSIFPYTNFNLMQSMVISDVYTDGLSSVVVSAPTGKLRCSIRVLAPNAISII
jgi:hypothetical protein